MTDEQLDIQADEQQSYVTPEDYEEFEIGEHKVPWFLWVFFIFIVLWASVSWIKFFGY